MNCYKITDWREQKTNRKYKRQRTKTAYQMLERRGWGNQKCYKGNGRYIDSNENEKITRIYKGRNLHTKLKIKASRMWETALTCRTNKTQGKRNSRNIKQRIFSNFTKERNPCLHLTILSQLKTRYKQALDITLSLYITFEPPPPPPKKKNFLFFFKSLKKRFKW